MSSRLDTPLTAAESRARGAVQSLRRPQADRAFRERLERDFTTGQVAARRTLVLLARPAVSWAWWALAPAAAALAIAIGIANRGPAWRVVETRGEGMVIVEGRPVPVQHLAGRAKGLAPGARITLTGTTEIEIASQGQLVVQITPGSEITLPRPPGRWFGRTGTGAVWKGEIRVTTGPRFRGASLALETPEAAIDVVGTTFAVICERAGTCVCVLEGTVRVGPKGAAMKPVAHGRRMYVFNDGRAPEDAAIRPNEIGKLGMFRDQNAGAGEAR
ncbi:MAG TPA: FecR domain-containing protein [Candidatus Limnocylindria bacterium]|nr:FecR domain-containing protein [Candidatus Limnocylindria bacterium]